MKKVLLLLLVIVALLAGCATTSLSPANSKFESETGIPLGVVSRALYSFGSMYEGGFYGDMVNALLDGRVELRYQPDQIEKARFSTVDSMVIVSINSIPVDYDRASKWMYMASVLAAISQIQSQGIGSADVAKERFFEAPMSWGTEFPALSSDPWFVNKDLEIFEDRIE